MEIYATSLIVRDLLNHFGCHRVKQVNIQGKAFCLENQYLIYLQKHAFCYTKKHYIQNSKILQTYH